MEKPFVSVLLIVAVLGCGDDGGSSAATSPGSTSSATGTGATVSSSASTSSTTAGGGGDGGATTSSTSGGAGGGGGPADGGSGGGGGGGGGGGEGGSAPLCIDDATGCGSVAGEGAFTCRYPDGPAWEVDVDLAGATEATCTFQTNHPIDGTQLYLRFRPPAEAARPDELIVVIPDFAGTGTYAIGNVIGENGMGQTRFVLRGSGSFDPEADVTAMYASRGCPPCTAEVTARGPAFPPAQGAHAEYDVAVTCGGQLGLEFGPAGQRPADDQACSLAPVAFGTCDVTSFSATIAARCVALTAP